MTIKTNKRHCRGSKSKAKKQWEKRTIAARKKPRHEPIKKVNTDIEDDGECVVCYNIVPTIENNIQMCNKATHILCAHCKLIILNKSKSCPLCRGHHVKRPIVPTFINIYKR